MFCVVSLYSQVDSGLGEEVVLIKVPGLPGNRLVYASTGPVNRDYDDIRRFSDAAVNGIKRSADVFLFHQHQDVAVFPLPEMIYQHLKWKLQQQKHLKWSHISANDDKQINW